MELKTLSKFQSEEDALWLIEFLQSQDIEFHVEDVTPSVDITFTGGSGQDYKLAVQVKASEYDAIEQLLDAVASDNANAVDADHYLYDFTDEELYDILKNHDTWSKMDFVLARNILKDRGHSVSDDELEAMVEARDKFLDQPEKGEKMWLVFGYLSASLGGILAILIGYYYYTLKKNNRAGERVYVYDDATRKSGKNIFFIGLIAVGIAIFWFGGWYH